MTSAEDTLRKILAQLTENIDCGCVPCVGQCWQKDDLRDEISNRCDLARDALKALDGVALPNIVCDDPVDIFTRATRNAALAA